jgi:hypothetical protein
VQPVRARPPGTALNYVNFGVEVFGDASATFPRRPDEILPASKRAPIRHCPVCGVAMQASKSRDDLTDFDTFECLNCHTVIRESKSRPPRSGGLNARKTPSKRGGPVR